MSTPSIGIQSTGIAEIDAQHRELLDCFERLAHWIGQGRGWAASLDAVTTLSDYTIKHFRDEEAYLHQHGYPRLNEHIREHERLLSELQALVARIHDGEEPSGELLDLLRNWILEHIGKEDMAFARHFAQQRIG